MNWLAKGKNIKFVYLFCVKIGILLDIIPTQLVTSKELEK